MPPQSNSHPQKDRPPSARGRCLAALFLVALLPSIAHAVSPAEHAVLTGHIDEAEQLLRASIAAANQPADHLLLCRALYAEQHFDDALNECQIAANATPPSSSAFLWLGRVEGARASRASALPAFVLARKVRAAFLRATEIDPGSEAAISDLGQYLVEAPGVVGGGLDQARALAQQSMSRTPSAAHHLLARVAEKSGDMALAERELHAAIDTARGPDIAGAWIDLAQFFTERGETDHALAAIRNAVAADSTHDDALVDAARLELRLHQPPAHVIPLLEQYLNSPNQSDAAPSFAVRYELANLLDETGDTAAAERERALAHGLAPGFQPHPSGKHPSEGDGQVP